jgi:predicted nucleic acid-binding protein
MICVDANVVAKLLFREEHSDKAFGLLEACTTMSQAIISTNLLPFEVTNIIRKRMRREGLPLNLARRVLGQFHSYQISLHSFAALHDRALSLASQFDLAASYDAHYVVLAQQNSCNLWTADDKLLSSLRGRLPFVRSLADYSSSESI